ncbi:hypothetical protein K7432_010358 [Basidiobolus ranarum]|uniref:Uncharacterized protein n=1 Tax=Basidiobolus ranarum TaxID=34480 RepID=A0ABR2WNU4_9FUNG
MLFQKPCNNTSLSSSQNSGISVAPLFPCLTKSLFGCKTTSHVKATNVSQNCTLAPVLSRFWRNLFPPGIIHIQRLHTESYSAATKSNYFYNVVESTGLAALGNNPLGFTTQRLYLSNSTSNTHAATPNTSIEPSSEYEFFTHNRDNSESPWEDFQLYDSDSDSEMSSDTSLSVPMLAPLNEIFQSRQNHDEKWERLKRASSSSNPESDSNSRRMFYFHSD